MIGETLRDRATTHANLCAAWDHVREKGSDDGLTPDSITRFAADADTKITKLAAELAERRYRPLPLSRVAIPKKDGSARELSVPSVRDRVVERALLNVVAAYADRFLGPASYAYREGIGVIDAVQAVVALRDEGLHWVLHADIDDCFDSIPREIAVRKLMATLPDDSLSPLIDALTTRPVSTRRGLVEATGVPQGTALSPLLANLVLADFDDALLDRGMPIVRYADDFVVLGPSQDSVWEAARVAAEALDAVGMSLGVDKTEVMNFDEGFCFLGEDFGPRYPPAIDGHRVDVPTRRILYCGRQGSRVFTRDGRVVVESKSDAELLSVPRNLVARIVCFGAVTLAAGTRSWTLEDGTDVVFLSRRGQYLGQQLSAVDGTRVARLRSQLEAVADRERSLPLARAIIDAKISHQVTLLQRFTRESDVEVVESALHTARQMRRMLPEAGTPDEILGLEGAAAAAYFLALGQMLPDGLTFANRSRRPPLDVVNSALGYGYALLLSECVSALVTAGLDPNIGVLHAASGRRPGLALDLMEELRPLIVDQVVLTAARRGALTVAHGEPIGGEPGIHLTKAGKAALVRAYEQRMQQVTSGAIPGFVGSWRRHIYRQAKLLTRAICDDGHQWVGMAWR
ncbi:CRISPR-associated endonuclease Cas1 [Gordonia sp. NPDC062954]|uniref:CRISPR-associated endonuclease Cas1 n=1 Tax=Gordonia sp. NPDC062954 TaxID=3364003 RepID=UPI0037C72A0A